MSLQHSPPPVSNNPSDPPLPPSTQPLTQSNIGTICCLCGIRMDEKIECLLIVKCNHYFHRACIENYLSKENKCPVCMIACELADLQIVSFPVKKGRPNKNTSGAVPKQCPTRSVIRNLFNESNPSGASNTPSRLRTSNRTDDNIQPASRNESVNFLPNSNQTLAVDYNEINKMIEINITKILQNLNLITNTSQHPTVYNMTQNIPQNQSNLAPRMESESNFLNNPNLNMPSSSYVGYQNDKVASIIQNWGLKFDGSSTGLTAEEFIYRLKSITRDTFNSDSTIICKNLHILLVGKARD
ncbi:uncharacterized protein LOC124420207 [Lucilia cuprina]|uniref:uncharacterized protein LOC124420207 n=1 Tax=Lucilia cuprina TaxID=7375 RepID=UPI001F053A89|nr:uncharacterized protein LOC124420207 [Lucilia cuprina]